MWICSSVDEVEALRPPRTQASVALGVFDGVHRGHRALLDVALAKRDLHTQVVVCTFNPHPKSVLRPDASPKAIASLATRLALLERIGVDGVLVHPFTHETAQETAPLFVRRVLVDALHARHVVVGDGFVFGHKRSGTVDVLRELGHQHHFTVHAHPPVLDGTTLISSSRVREALARGDLEQANRWLELPYTVCGRVVPGDQRGRTLGFPTANVAPDVAPLLPYGVYAARARLANGAHADAAVSIGVHPTFEKAVATKVEAFLLDVGSPDLYDTHLSLKFLAHVRPEARFEDRESLIAQMHQDVATVRTTLAQHSIG